MSETRENPIGRENTQGDNGILPDCVGTFNGDLHKQRQPEIRLRSQARNKTAAISGVPFRGRLKVGIICLSLTNEVQFRTPWHLGGEKSWEGNTCT